FFVNASATGKTRLLYEGLFQNWGFYITARTDDREAGTLQKALRKTFPGEDKMLPWLPSESSLGFQILLDGNLQALDRRFSLVLLVHLLIFREFLKAAQAEGVVEDKGLRQRWLLAQLWYPCLGEKEDIHKQLLSALGYESITVINDILNKTLDELKPLLPAFIKEDGLFIAIDEANIANEPIWRGCSEKHTPTRSIIRIWRDRLAFLGCPITFIVAGTEISKENFPTTSSEWSSWRWTSDTGSFDNREVQEKYILPFLPPTYAETPSGKALLQRVWNWCRPR
ncbi:hypothetical protein H0H87_008594, partial [Tephrocybe sp. NHM501043]